MKMTRKQAKDIADNIDGWNVREQTDLIQVMSLDVGDRVFIAIRLKQLTNITDVYIHQADPETGFSGRAINYYEYDKVNECVSGSISASYIANMIYQYANEGNS